MEVLGRVHEGGGPWLVSRCSWDTYKPLGDNDIYGVYFIF